MAIPVGHGGIDYPDFGIFPTEHAYPQAIDMSELAIRLGCPQTLERVGQVLLIDQFQHGLGSWVTAGAEPGDLVELSSAYFRHVPYSAHLHSHGIFECGALLRRQLDFAYEKTVGFEVSFLARADFNELWFTCYVQTDTVAYAAKIAIDDANQQIEYGTSGNTFEVIAAHDLTIHSASGWHILKLVVDVDNLEYKRIVLDRSDYDLSGIAMYSGSVVYRDYLEVAVQLLGATSSENDIWVDDVIITVGEPV